MIPPDSEPDSTLPPGTEEPPAPAAPPAARLGTGTFTIEGRAAPALFVVGWLGTLVGAVVLFVSFMAQEGAAQVLLLVGLAVLAIGLVAAAGSQGIERRARSVQPYRGPSPILVFATSIPVALLLQFGVGLVLSLVGVGFETPAALVALSVTLPLVYTGLVRLLVVDVRALGWREMGWTPLDGGALRELLVGASWALPIIFVTGILAYVLTELLKVEPVGPLEPAGEPVGFAANLIVGVLLAPLGEELFFRGYATTAWRRALGTTGAVVRGGLFFAFVHVLTISAASAGEALPVAFIAFAGRIPIGLFLGWLFVRRGTIWAPIGLHAAFNAVLLILAENAPPAG